MQFKETHRGNFSYDEFNSHDTSVQPQLPEILLSYDHVLRVQT